MQKLAQQRNDIDPTSSKNPGPKGCLAEFELVSRLGIRDVDREIAFTLLSLACNFDRWEIDQVVAYVVHADEIEMGRLVIAPGIGTAPCVRIRARHAVLEQQQQQQQDTVEPTGEARQQADFADLCRHIHQALESVQGSGGSTEAAGGDHDFWSAAAVTCPLHRADGTRRDSDHYAYPPNRRREIVRHYRQGRASGHVRNKDDWARRTYQISGRTLSNYEREFPQTDEDDSDGAISETTAGQ